jgi:RNase P subunit RPR2
MVVKERYEIREDPELNVVSIRCFECGWGTFAVTLRPRQELIVAWNCHPCEPLDDAPVAA